MRRGMLCRACYSDSALQGCPCVLVTPWPSGYLEGTGDGLPVSSVSPHLSDLHIHSEPSSAFSGSQWTQGAAWARSVGRNCMWGNLLWNLTFLMFRSALAFLRKSQQWQRAPCRLGWRLFAQQLYLLTWLYYFLLYFFSWWDDRTFASRPNPKHLEVYFSALFSMVGSYLWAKHRYLHRPCKRGRTVLILPKTQPCNDDFSGIGPAHALEIITGISQCQALG